MRATDWYRRCLYSPHNEVRLYVPIPPFPEHHMNRKGFTLIELLIVVVIIGILAAIAIPKFSSVKQKGYRTQAISDLKSLSTAEETFFTDSNKCADLTNSADRKS